MIRAVLTFPNPMLKRACEPADRRTAVALAQDLVDTMRAHPGCVGIAAPQIGEPMQVAIVDVSGHRLTTSCHGLLLLINPNVRQAAGHRVAREGCLSLPTITADVGRASRIEVEAEAGRTPVWSEGFEARAILHEMDHLEGILILDRVTSVHALHPRMA